MNSDEVRNKSADIRMCRRSVLRMDEAIASLKSYRVIEINRLNELQNELREDYYEAEKIRS